MINVDNIKLRSLVTVLCSLAMMMSCSSDSELLNDVINGEKDQYMEMQLIGDIVPFDAAESRAGTSAWEWHDEDVVYIQFHTSSSNIVKGSAKYDKSANAWTVYYHGFLTDNGSCEVYFFEDATSTDKSKVSMDGTVGVYADKNGTYRIENGVLVLNAMIKPQTSRIRFKGTPNMNIKVSGISTYAGYDTNENKLSSTDEEIVLSVQSDGYTPYLYGVFSDATNPEISIKTDIDGEVMLFKKSFDSSVLKVGESGFMTIPNNDFVNGWLILPSETRKIISVGDVTFEMILVEGGTFTMGATEDMINESWADEKPTHEVTLSSYYIGETEVTQVLWEAVMGNNPSDFKNPQNPVEQVSWDDCQEFITKLNKLSGKIFRLPTEAEWEFAARGGNESLHTQYSGSNNIEDVAWYSDNSGRMTHPVKQKKANELGLYDMSGNVDEWCQDWYGSYTSDAQTNPTGPNSGTYLVVRGGAWNTMLSYCRPSFRSYGSNDFHNYDFGLRLALPVF